MSEIEDWLKTALPITAKMIYGFETDISLRQKLYEQLDQLKAENEELKDKNNSIHSIASGLQQRNHNLTLENEELKKYIDRAGVIGIIKVLKCLDKIEEICHEHKEELNYLKDEYNFALVIIQLIKQAKECEE